MGKMCPRRSGAAPTRSTSGEPKAASASKRLRQPHDRRRPAGPLRKSRARRGSSELLSRRGRHSVARYSLPTLTDRRHAPSGSDTERDAPTRYAAGENRPATSRGHQETRCARGPHIRVRVAASRGALSSAALAKHVEQRPVVCSNVQRSQLPARGLHAVRASCAYGV